ncbi:MAG: ATP-binding protein [Polyangia bacterium]
MELDPQELKEKALLLLRRERELFELRMKHDRLEVWLKITQALPQLFVDPGRDVLDAYREVRKLLLDTLRLQRVVVVEVGEQALVPLVPAGAQRPLSSEVLALLRADRSGIVDEKDGPAASAFAETIGLARFIWSRIDPRGHPSLILAGGYDRAKARFFPPFEANDASNLQNVAQHINGLVDTAILLSHIQRDRDRLIETNALLESRDTELSTMADMLRAANEGLEQRVVERTVELEQRNRHMRLVLDNVPAALVTVDCHGRMAQERSAKVDAWFGTYRGTPLFADYIAPADPGFAAWFALGHEALEEQVLPLELCLDQLPKRMRPAGRIMSCSYRPIPSSSDGMSLLIMIEDVTEQRRLAQEEAEQSELLAVCQWLTRDRGGLLIFIAEADRLVRELLSRDTDPVMRGRHLHTLKGNAAMMGAQVIAELCHRAEDASAIDDSELDHILARLQARWTVVRQAIESLLGGRHQNIIEVSALALEQLCQDVERGLDREHISGRLRLLACEPVERPLARLVRYATQLAERLGKPNLQVTVESDPIQLDPGRFTNLWTTLVHLVRNAVDHGVESPAERCAQGKAPEGRIVFRAFHTATDVILEVEDDGRGIDWATVASHAHSRGLPYQSEADLMRALVIDGLSTRQAVTHSSGRGVGISAVHHEVESLGGELTVQSQLARGTCWRLRLPLRPP